MIRIASSMAHWRMVGRAHHAWGMMLERKGERGEAAGHFAEAEAIFRPMGAWLYIADASRRR